jgi:hypothetical protein
VYGHIEQLEVKFKQEVEQLLALAESTDQSQVLEGMTLPEEIKRRQDRLASMNAAKAKIEKRAQARYEREKAEYDAKMAARAEKEKSSGRKPSGKPPQAPDPMPRVEDQVNLTDSESRINKALGWRFRAML